MLFKSDTFFFVQDRGIFSILEELENNNEMENSSSKSRLIGQFCSDTVFNLSKRVLREVKIKILEEVLDCPPIQNKINEPATTFIIF